jgi:hypothetical protein
MCGNTLCSKCFYSAAFTKLCKRCQLQVECRHPSATKRAKWVRKNARFWVRHSDTWSNVAEAFDFAALRHFHATASCQLVNEG